MLFVLYLFLNLQNCRGFPNTSNKKEPVIKKSTGSSERVADEVGSDEEDFAMEGLRIHNDYRRKHGVPDLKLSREASSTLALII